MEKAPGHLISGCPPGLLACVPEDGLSLGQGTEGHKKHARGTLESSQLTLRSCRDGVTRHNLSPTDVEAAFIPRRTVPLYLPQALGALAQVLLLYPLADFTGIPACPGIRCDVAPSITR